MRSFYNTFRSSAYALPNGTEPLILLDFKNGVYMANGQVVAMGDLLAEDENYGPWNPARIQAGTGLVGNNDVAPVFTGDALDLILGGSTTLTSIVLSGDHAFRYEMTDNFSDYGLYYSSLIGSGSHASPIDDDEAPNPLPDDGVFADGAHQSALTFVDGKISRSTDGSAIITINPAKTWASPAPGAMGFVVPIGHTIEQIGIYPPQPDADLPMLSAL